jgi:signal transduction histidine kinase
MADRLDAVGGDLDVTSAPGTGTTVVRRVPIAGTAR